MAIRRLLRTTLISACICFLATGSGAAQSTFATGERFTEEVVFRGLPVSTAVAFAPGERIFIAVKQGIVRVAVAGQLLQTPFLDISSIVNKVTDRGLLGIAVDPEFPLKPFVYLAFVYDPPGSTPDLFHPRLIRVVRYRADASKDFNVAEPNSEEVILGKNSTLENMAPYIPDGQPNNPEAASCMTGLTMNGQPIQDCIPCDADSHTAGTLLFASDRSLIVSVGDGSSYDRPSTLSFRAMNPDAMSGRVMRIDPDTGLGLPGNPFFDPNDSGSNRSRVWSYGFRNPFRVTLNSDNGQIYIGDVGTSYYEEINVGKGGYFGWPCYEGGFFLKATQEGPADESVRQVGFKKDPFTIDTCNALYAKGQEAVVKPLFTYRHPYDETGKDLGSSITGLAFYSGSKYPPKYRGALFFADYARRFIRYLTFDESGYPTRHEFAAENSGLGAVQLIVGPDTNLYAVYIDLKTRTSEVRRFIYIESENAPPTVRAVADRLAGDIPLTVQFSSTGTYDLDGQSLSFVWDFGDGTPQSTEQNPSHVYAQVGTFQAKLTVAEKTAPFASSSEIITIRTGVSPPIAIIDSPPDGTRYRIGDSISFSGRASDSHGSPTDLVWSILQHHNDHEHLVAEVPGESGAFTPAEHTDNTSYKLCLHVTAGEGLADQKCLSILPDTVPYSISSSPLGATITYIDDERELIAPTVIEPAIGAEQTLTAANFHAGMSFERWSDGLNSVFRTFRVGPTPITLTAIYVNKPPKAVINIKRLNSAGSFRFDGSGAYDPENSSLRYQWKFSTKGTGKTPVITKQFKRPGVYWASLTVTDSLGLAASTVKFFTVKARKR